VLDEATSSVDPATAAVMHEVRQARALPLLPILPVLPPSCLLLPLLLHDCLMLALPPFCRCRDCHTQVCRVVSPASSLKPCLPALRPAPQVIRRDLAGTTIIEVAHRQSTIASCSSGERGKAVQGVQHACVHAAQHCTHSMQSWGNCPACCENCFPPAGCWC
jgi:hypothetical protein